LLLRPVVFGIFLLVSVGALFLGCAPSLVGERHLVPDPLWLQSGHEVRDGFLICGSQGSEVGIKFLKAAELQELLKSQSKDPTLFEPAPVWLEGAASFLISASNKSKVPMIFEGQHAVLRDDKGSKLQSLEYTDLYEVASQDPAADRKMKVLGSLLFSPSPVAGGESRQGLLVFGSFDPEAKKAALSLSFLFGGRPLQTEQCVFPFAVEVFASSK
jgi:hypothetical protein